MKAVFAMMALLLATPSGSSADWPQWLGTKRDGVWREAGVRKDLPKGGAKVLWRAAVSWGYAGPAVADGKVYVPDFVMPEDEFDGKSQGGRPREGKERILCLDAKTGKAIWSHEYDVTYAVSYPGGPRVTPTIKDGSLYFQGTMGHLRCLDANTGKLKWKRDICAEYNCDPPRWGYSSHPLVHGNLVYAVAGGEGSVLLALDKSTGKEIWKKLSAEEAGYCPPLVVSHGGVEQLLFWYPEAVVSLNPKSGEEYWSVELKPIYGISRMAPRLLGNKLYVAGPGRSHPAVLLELDSEKPGVKELWRGGKGKAVNPLNAPPHLMDGVIYGVDSESSALIAVSMEDGEASLVDPRGESPPRLSRAFASRNRLPRVSRWQQAVLDLRGDGGPDPRGTVARRIQGGLGRQHVIEPTNGAWGRKVVWTHPAYAMKSAFIRNDKEIIRIDLSE